MLATYIYVGKNGNNNGNNNNKKGIVSYIKDKGQSKQKSCCFCVATEQKNVDVCC